MRLFRRRLTARHPPRASLLSANGEANKRMKANTPCRAPPVPFQRQSARLCDPTHHSRLQTAAFPPGQPLTPHTSRLTPQIYSS